MANPATKYLKETTRSGCVLWDTPVCQSCLDIHTTEVQFTQGEQRTIRQWTGEPRPCGMCEDEEKAEMISRDFAAGCARVVVLLLALLVPGIASADDHEALILPLKVKFHTVNTASDYYWHRPIERHTKIALAANVVTTVADVVMTAIVVRTVNQIERKHGITLINSKEALFAPMFTASLAVATNFSLARRLPKTTTASALLGSALSVWNLSRNYRNWRDLQPYTR